MKTETNFEDYKAMFNFNHPNETLKSWVTAETFDEDHFKNWETLMEIVDKIEQIRVSTDKNSMRFDIHIKQHSCWIDDWEIEGKKFIHMGGFDSKLSAVYNLCLEFTKWYNQQNS